MFGSGRGVIITTAGSFLVLGILTLLFIRAVPQPAQSPALVVAAEPDPLFRLVGVPANPAEPVVAFRARTLGTPADQTRSALLAFTGDTLAHGAVVRQGAANASGTSAEYDFAPMFDGISSYISAADLAICHLETPLSPDNTDLAGFPTFNVPREMADGLRASGYDGCTTASNHSLDRRPEGVANTLTVLDDAGLGHSGMARDQAEYDDVTLYDANGITVASLSYSYGFNGFREPEETPWLVNEIDVDEIVAEADRARDAGADFVVLSVHWGDEYRHEPSQFQLDNAEALVAAADIDLIIGHHAHVVQPIDIVDGVPVVFGLGNILSNQTARCCAAGAPDGIVMLVDVQETFDGARSAFTTSFGYVPTRVDRSDFSIVPVIDALADADAGRVELPSATRDVYVASRERTADALNLFGSDVGIVEVTNAQ